MGVLELVPQSWLSWNFNVLQDGRPIAEIDISRWRERGVLGLTARIMTSTARA